MSIEEHGYNQYKNFLHGKWQKNILLISWLVAFLILGIEIMACMVFIKHEEQVGLSYVILRIIVPSVLNLSTLSIATFVRRSEDSSVNAKNHWASFSIFMICAVIAIFHNYFHILLGAPGIVFFICAVFGETKILNRLLIATVPVYIISAATFCTDPHTPPDGLYKILSLVCNFTFISCSYIFSHFLMRAQASQLKYIHDSYRRHADLIEELKIEPLTKLYNRSALDGAIARIIEKKKLCEINPFLVMLDIDFFKKINDEFGHIAGDKVLVTLSEIIRKNMGSSRRAFRYGGEEFVLIFEDSMPTHVIYTVQSIRYEFAATRFDFAPDNVITLSAGVSGIGENFTAQDWLESADKSLYYAKNHGRNQLKMSVLVTSS